MPHLIRKLKNPDGTIARPAAMFPIVPASTTDPSSPSLSKDVPLINSNSSVSVRLYLPRETLSPSLENSKKKLPVVVYAHGGGFAFNSVANPNYHDFCSYAASQLGALVVSVEYRLAPEHRLPAAYEDALEALAWVKDAKDGWISEFGDLTNCVMMGDSSGANMVYHAGLMVAAKADDFKPLVIKGLVMVQPFFSGLNLTGSELRLIDDPVYPNELLDMCWDFCLPVGAKKDHEYCDPTKDGGSGMLDRFRDLGWWVAVVSCDGDPLYDRSVNLVKLMEKKRVSVKTMFYKGGQHGMFVGNPSKFKANELLDFVKGLLFPQSYNKASRL